MTSPRCRLVVWGHSLGAAVACRTLFSLETAGTGQGELVDTLVLYCTVLCCAVLYCTVLYCTVLYCTVLYCTVLC